jgi:Flp pilus assembly CpaF family ATPase
MSEKTRLLYELMLRKGYPEEFSRLICLEMNTDFTAERMMYYVSGEKKRLEDVADEMLAIKDLRDRLIDKHISEHAQISINDLYRNINED